MNFDYKALNNDADPVESNIALDIKTIRSEAKEYQVASPLINQHNEWLSVVGGFLTHSDLSRMSEVCRFFIEQQSLLFANKILDSKHNIVTLSITLASHYAHDKIMSSVAAQGEMAEYTEFDRESEQKLRQASIARLINHDQVFLLKLKLKYNKREVCFKFSFTLYWLFIIAATTYLIYSLASDRDGDWEKDLSYGYSIGLSAFLFCCCYKCGLFRVDQNSHVDMIRALERSFSELRNLTLSQGSLSHGNSSTLAELQRLQLLSTTASVHFGPGR